MFLSKTQERKGRVMIIFDKHMSEACALLTIYRILKVSTICEL